MCLVVNTVFFLQICLYCIIYSWLSRCSTARGSTVSLPCRPSYRVIEVLQNWLHSCKPLKLVMPNHVCIIATSFAINVTIYNFIRNSNCLTLSFYFYFLDFKEGQTLKLQNEVKLLIHIIMVNRNRRANGPVYSFPSIPI